MQSLELETHFNQMPHCRLWFADNLCIEGTPQYFNIVAKLLRMTSVWDKKTWIQYAYFGDGGLVLFDNKNVICAKVQ